MSDAPTALCNPPATAAGDVDPGGRPMPGPAAPSAGEAVTVVFRYDDYSGLSPMEVDSAVVRAFATRRLQCTFSVIPFASGQEAHAGDDGKGTPLPPEKVTLLKAAVECGAVDVALHGHSHRMVGRPKRSEFRGLGPAEQRRKIAEGRTCLEGAIGREVVLFVPPWNSYDRNTLSALEECGFCCLSAGTEGPAPKGSGLRYAPSTCELAGLRRAIAEALGAGDRRSVIVCLFHPYDLAESGDRRAVLALVQFGQLLDWIASLQGVRCASIGQLLRMDQDLSPARCSANSECRLPSPLAGRRRGVYLPTEPAAKRRRGWFAGACAFYLLCLASSFGVSYAMGSMDPLHCAALLRPGRWAALALSLLCFGYGLRDGALGWKGLTASVALVGCFLGVGASLA